MKGLRVLLVDDEEEFVNTLAERLRLRGIQVAVASSGEEAIAIAGDLSPTVVVLDVMMPGLGGIETLSRIKSIDPHNEVILLTGHGCTKDGIKGMRLGACDYLVKPVDIDDLINKLKAAWKNIEGQ